MTERVNSGFKEIYKKFNYGIYVLGSAYDGNMDLITCSWVMQGSYDKGELIVNISKDRPIFSLIEQSGQFSVSILGNTNINEALVCAKKSAERSEAIKKLKIENTSEGIPYLHNSLAYLTSDFTGSYDLATSTLLIGTPKSGQLLSTGEALTLHEYYKLKA